MTLTLSVVVAQRHGDVTECLKSLHRLHDPAHEVIVVVPGFTEKYAANGAGSGCAESRVLSGERPWERGLSAARGDVVAFLDHDARVEPQWTAEVLRPYEDPTVVAVGGRVTHGETGGERPELVGRLLPDGRLTDGFSADLDRVVEVDHLAGAVLTGRRGALLAAGGIHGEEGMPRHWQVADLSLRLRRYGRLVYQPSAVTRTAVPERRRPSGRELYAARRDHVVLLARNADKRARVTRTYAYTVVGAQQTYAAKIRRWLRDPVASRRPWGHRIRKIGQAISSSISEVLGLAVGLLRVGCARWCVDTPISNASGGTQEAP